MPSAVLPIVCAINHSYVLPLAVMLESLKQHLRANWRPVLYLLHTGIPQARLSIISSIIDMHSIIPSNPQIAAAPCDAHFPAEASFLLLIPDLLPNDIQRVLFLDADMLVLDDVMKLWVTPLDECVLAAVPDTAVPYCSAPRGVNGWQTLGIPADAPYFNGGVLVVDLERWRQGEVTRRVSEYFKTTREPIDFLHQGVLNALLWNHWKRLDSRWNLLASVAGRPYDKTASEAWRQPGIVHFAGRMKPWRAPIGGPFDVAYRKVLESLLPLIPSEPSSMRDRFHSLYDRYLRSALYPVEQYLWRRRLL